MGLKLVRIGDGLSSPWGGVVTLLRSPYHLAFCIPYVIRQ